jgi:parallel beta-helix repeat protein
MLGFQRQSAKKRSSRGDSLRRTFGLHFEPLEDRRMLSATLWVDNNPANAIAHPGDYTTISAAVANASPGDTIKVSPGTAPYTESVTVDKPLTIIGGLARLAGEHGATIVEVPSNATPALGAAGFDLQADNITIKSFTIRPSATLATSDVDGIWTHFANSGEQILNNVFAGDTTGLYLNSNGAKKDYVLGNTFAANNFAGSGQGNGIYSDQGLKNVEIIGNFFSGDTNASIILVGGDFASQSFGSLSTHSNVRILLNTINNDSPIIAVNMVNSTIDFNTITNPQQGSGIALVGAVTQTEVSYNNLQGNAAGFTGINLFVSDIASGGGYYVAHLPGGAPVPNSGDKILGNNISGWGDDGIRLRDGTNGVLVSGNVVTANGTAGVLGDGISIEDSYSNFVLANVVNSNRLNGISLSDAQANTVSGNAVGNNGADGILVSAASTGNTISYNTANHNGDFVLFTGNGIHLVDSDSNTVSYNTATSNANDGILVEGTSSLNILKRNTAKKNHNWDIEDISTGLGNTWLNNNATLRNPSNLG